MKYQQLALQTARLSDDKSEYKRVKLKLKFILSFKIVLIILCFVFAILAVIHVIFTKTDRERTYKQLLPYLVEGEFCYVDLYPKDEISNYKTEISEYFNVGSSNKGTGFNHIRNYHFLPIVRVTPDKNEQENEASDSIYFINSIKRFLKYKFSINTLSIQNSMILCIR